MLNHAAAALAELPREISDVLPPGRAVSRRLAALARVEPRQAGAGPQAMLARLAELSERIAGLDRRLADLVRAGGPS